MDMNNMTEEKDFLQTDTLPLYSQRAIAISTFFGGPLAAGILARRNFINLGHSQSGRNALIIGILSTILLFAGLFSLPESIIDKIPNVVIPLIYTGIIYLIIEKYQGVAIKEHTTNHRPFYSAWKAVGVGVVCMAIIIVGIFGYTFLTPDDFGIDEDEYNTGIHIFQMNEEKALHLYSMLDEDNTTEDIILYIDEEAIPAWEQNLQLLDGMDKIEGLSDAFKEQNKQLRQYTVLNIEKFGLIKKAVAEEDDADQVQIEQLDAAIDKLLDEHDGL